MTEPTHIIKSSGAHAWYVNGKLHREDGPAIIWPHGYQAWWVNGERHRLDGPAAIWADGRQLWYVNSLQYYNNRSFQEAAGITDEEMVIVILKYGNVK